MAAPGLAWGKMAATAVGIVVLGALLVFGLWRYTPVRIRPQQIEKVVLNDATAAGRAACARFQMTPQQFAAHFAALKRILPIETEQYGFGACYLKTTIENKTYVIWQGFAAEIREGEDIEFYAASKYLVAPAEEGNGWLFPLSLLM